VTKVLKLKKKKIYSKMSPLTLLSLSNTEQSAKTQYFRHLMSTKSISILSSSRRLGSLNLEDIRYRENLN
jgi:hypothetical protein